MERVRRYDVFGASRVNIVKNIQTKFKNTPGISNVVVTGQYDTHCTIYLTFDQNIYPGVNPTSITVWYDYHVVKNGTRMKTKWIKWSPNLSVNDDGTVVDENGEIVGEVRIIQSTSEKIQKTKKNFLLKSIRTDSGDVIIDHPESVSDNSIYQNVVKTLANRTVTRRS